MTRQETCTDSASPSASLVDDADKERMISYKRYAVAYSYPEDDIFNYFPEMNSKREKLLAEYDKLFRANEIWLYGSEYTVKSEFQIAQNLADIMGFYRAFGLEPDKDRPDSLFSELEFMYYLIFKRVRAIEADDTAKGREKALICLDAEKKFFQEHLYPAATKIIKTIAARAADGFYKKISNEMSNFLEAEKKHFGGVVQ